MNPQTTPNSIEENEIILGNGMGPLRFGATMDEVRTLVGDYYEDDHLLSLYFDREDDFRLSCIETDNPGLRLYGEALHGRTIEQVRDLMQRHGQVNPELETMEGGEVRLSYEKSMIDMYFEEGQLQFVNFGVFINDELEVQWPTK
jgi:hypothetical protein